MISINALGVATVPIDLVLSVFEVVVGWRLTNEEILKQHGGLERDVTKELKLYAFIWW